MVGCSDYRIDVVRSALENLLAPLGGMGNFVKPGNLVLIKPNMLAAKPPDAAVTTHPSIVQAVAELVASVGGEAVVGDSPGLGPVEKVAERSGILDAAKTAGARVLAFSGTRVVPAGGTFRQVELSTYYLDADVVINLPKLKTHEMMTMTCAVKNLFGAVVGSDKAGLHFTAGRSKELFAGLMLDIAQARPVSLTITDAVVGMEGNGPNSGVPRHVGWLIASENLVALDVVAARMIGIPPNLLPIEQEATRRSIPGSVMEDIMLCGDVDSLPELEPFLLPDGMDTQFGLPGFLAGILRRYLTPLPVADEKRCLLCGICRDVCPPKAITINKNALNVDSGRCIRCWCCRELCPHNAMGVYRSPFLRFIERSVGREKDVP